MTHINAAKNPLINIVDDDVEITEMLEAILSDDYAVASEANPVQYLDSLRKKEIPIPSVLILDLSMPQMNGLEVLREIKNLDLQIPTILFTGHLSKEDAILALELGVVHLLEKPVDARVLKETVKETLIDWEILKTQDDLRTLTQQIKEIYSVFRLVVSKHIPEDDAKDLMIGDDGSPQNFEQILEDLENKLEFLMKEENLLIRTKRAQYKKDIKS